MGRKPKRHCGTDLHESYIRAVIVNNNDWDNDEDIIAEAEFVNDVVGHLAFIRWLREHGCRHVGMESTGVYWKALAYALIEHGMVVKVGNAQQMQNVLAPKTDKLDARWIARLMRDGYIPESNILTKEHDDFRTMVRARIRLVRDRTATKNRISALIAKAGLRMKCSDKFGRFGRKVLKAIAKGDDLDSIFKSKQGEKLGYSQDEFIALLETHMTQPFRQQLAVWLDRLEELDRAIEKVEKIVLEMINNNETTLEQIEIIRSTPGFADIASGIVLAEIGDIFCFPQSKHFCSYCGLVPYIYQSGKKTKDGEVVVKINTGRLKSTSNKYLKWIFVQAATAISRLPETPLNASLKKFYRRILGRHSGRYKKQKAICALAHKLAKIIWTLLTTGEKFRGADGSEKDIRPLKKVKPTNVGSSASLLRKAHETLISAKKSDEKLKEGLPDKLIRKSAVRAKKELKTLWDIDDVVPG
jgi:transposase